MKYRIRIYNRRLTEVCENFSQSLLTNGGCRYREIGPNLFLLHNFQFFTDSNLIFRHHIISVTEKRTVN
jgi:hypothetical protein